MKIHEYNEMMRWLTRPAGPDPRSMPQEPRIADREPYYMGGRVGFQQGSVEFSRRGTPKVKGSLLRSPLLKDKQKAWNEMKDLRQKFIKKYGRVPNKKEFAEFSGYSREALTTAQDKINLKLAKGPTQEAITAGAYKRGEVVRAKPVDQPTVTRKGPQGQQVRSGVRWPNEKVKKEILDQLRLRFKYPRLSAEGKAAGVLSNAELKAKYFKPTTSDSLVKEALYLAAQEEGIKPEYPSIFGKEAEKGREYAKRRTEKLKKVSDWSYEKKIKGTPNTHLHHMQSKRFNVTTRTLGYAPPKMNVDTLVGIERKLDALYIQREKLLKDKPKDLIKKLEDINVKGMNIVADPKVKGYLNFKIMDPKTLRMSDYGANIARTIDPADLLKGKAIKDLTEADKALIELNRATVMEREVGPRALPKMKQLLGTASDSLVNKIGAVLGCRKVAAEGGRIGLQAGSGLIPCITSKLDNDLQGTLAKVANEVPETKGPIRSALGMTGKAFGKFLALAAGPLEAGFMGAAAEQGKSMTEVLATPFVLEGAARENRIRNIMGDDSYQEFLQHHRSEADPVFYGEGEATGKRLDPNLETLRSMAVAQVQQEDDARKEEARQFNLRSDETMFNQGGRVGLAKGPKDPSKRVFLKGVAMASMIPILGKYFKLAAPATKAAAQYTGPILEGIGSKLKWVQLLAKRLWDEGEDATKALGTKEREVVMSGKLESGDNVYMHYDMDTKNVRFSVEGAQDVGQSKYIPQDTKSGAFHRQYDLEYKAPEIIEEGKHAGKKTKSEVKVVEETPHQVTPEDVELDISESTVDSAFSDLTELEAFAKKKTVKQIHKKKGTKPKDVSPDYEPPDWYDLDYDID